MTGFAARMRSSSVCSGIVSFQVRADASSSETFSASVWTTSWDNFSPRVAATSSADVHRGAGGGIERAAGLISRVGWRRYPRMDFPDAIAPISDWIAEGTLERAAAVVAHRGRIVAERCWGSAADGGALDAHTLLPFASLTKPALMTAILRLVERGVLPFDLTIGDTLAGAPVHTRAITIAHLLTHTAGFPEYVPGVNDLAARRAPVDDYVCATLDSPLLFEPGTRVLYSNAGFQVLGAMVERVTALPLPDLLDRDVFGPLGMRSATLRPLARPGVRVARVELGARANDRATDVYNSPYFMRLARADAGLFATPRDVITLMEMYRTGGAGVIGAALARDAIISHTHGIPGRYGPYEWESCDFGWSWEIRDGKSPHPTGARTSPGTFGHIGGSGALAFCDPERELTAVIHTLRDFSDGWAAERPYLTRVATTLVEVADAARP